MNGIFELFYNCYKHYVCVLMTEEKNFFRIVESNSPSTDVARCDDRFAGSSEQACQVEAFVARCLKAFAELDDDDVGHRVAVLY